MLGFVVSAALAPKDSYFLPNATFYWVQQLAVIALLLIFRPRPAIISGVAFALALYLAAFGAWVFTRTHRESMSWLGYIFSLPGALVGGIIIAVWLRRRPTLQPLVAACISASAVLIGIFINQAVVCGTVMYCAGK